MYEDRVIAAVVPAHNEAAHIRDVISGLPAIVDHIVIVDDKSADDTAQLAETSGDPRVRVIRHERNPGVGGAIISGHKLALELGSDVDGIIDDLQSLRLAMEDVKGATPSSAPAGSAPAGAVMDEDLPTSAAVPPPLPRSSPTAPSQDTDPGQGRATGSR